MTGEVFAVLEVEFLLAASLGRHTCDVALIGGVAEDRRAELLIDEDSRPCAQPSVGRYCRSEAVINHLLAR
jgi:hypothetical protein